MVDNIDQILVKYYTDIVVKGESNCFFVTTEEEAKYRASVDDFCDSYSVSNVVKIQMSEEELLNPLLSLSNIIYKILSLKEQDPKESLRKFADLHPEYNIFLNYLIDKKLPRIIYHLPDDVTYLQMLMVRCITELINHLTVGTEPYMIFITGFQYASTSFLHFFSSFINSKYTGNFLIFCTFCPTERSSLANSHDNSWTKWIWELECSGKLIHQSIINNRDNTVEWITEKNKKKKHNRSIMNVIDEASTLMDMVCFPEALTILKNAQGRINDTMSHEVIGKLILLLGKTQLLIGHHEEALVNFDRLNDMGQKYNDQELLCLSNLELAYTHIFRRDYNAAQRYIAYSLKYAQNTPLSVCALQARYCEFIIHDLAAISFSYEKIKLLISDLKANNLLYETVYVLCRIFSQEPFNDDLTNDMCLDYIDEAISLSRDNSFLLAMASCYHAKGVIFVKLELIEDAINCFKISESIRVKFDVPGELARIKNGIGYLYCLKEDFNQSHDYYVDAMRTVINLNDLAEIASTLYNLAWLYFQVGENSGALNVLDTLKEILKIKNTKYFPFRNLHDVFLLQGFVFFSQGMYVNANQMVQNSINLDIEISSQGSLMRPLLQSLIATVYQEYNTPFTYLEEAEKSWKLSYSQLNPLNKLLYHICRIYVYRCWNMVSEAYKEVKLVTEMCKTYNYKIGLQKVSLAWQQIFPQFELNFKVPKVELKQVLFIIKQEQSVNELWNQVYGMRLCSLLQQLCSGSDDLSYISGETIRLLCMHYNVQGGFVYINNQGSPKMLSSYSQLKNFIFSYAKFEKFILEKKNKNDVVYNKVTIENTSFSSIVMLPLLYIKKIIGHIVLTTTIGNFSAEKTEIETLRFISNQLAIKIINSQQNNMLMDLSTKDQLTGLKNRQYFQIVLSNVSKESICALAFIDLDNFKHYNDSFGHDVGDQLLILFSKLLKTVENENTNVCRWGGDEFLILFKNSSVEKAEKIMFQLQSKLRAKNGFLTELSKFIKRTIFLEEKYYLDFSAGISYVDSDTKQINKDLLLKIADSTLYEVKRSGKGQIVTKKYTDYE